MSLVDLEVIEQTNGVLGHRQAILLGVVWLLAAAVAAAIQRDDLVLFRQLLAHGLPLRLDVDGEAVDQEHRLTVFLALDDVVNLDASGVEGRLFHLGRLSLEASRGKAEKKRQPRNES